MTVTRQAPERGSFMVQTHDALASDSQIEMHAGDDFACLNCGCEIMLKRHGDPSKMLNMTMFTCCCGHSMEFEHPRAPAGA